VSSLELQELTSELAALVNRHVEHTLVERIEAKLGRVPSNDEVRCCGYHLVGFPDPDWHTYFWNGDVVLCYTTRWKDYKLELLERWEAVKAQ
jgi:hypothetical protein